MNRYIVVGSKFWVKNAFDELTKSFDGQWHYIQNKEDLTLSKLKAIDPEFIFFVHWSWIVPEEILNIYTCVCFHMTDVPFGRGGSPLQNLLLRGFKKTKLTALKMTSELDAGPVYLKEDLLLDGSAEEIYIRMSKQAVKMAEKISLTRPIAIEQKGEVTLFKRRKPEESLIPEMTNIEGLHDFIRMLDADGYPHAFLNYNGFRFEFVKAQLENDQQIQARVTIKKIKD